MTYSDPKNEVFFSVDIETAGPYPRRYALLSIGACLVSNPDETFYIEIRPESDDSTLQALEITGLSMEELAAHGVAPAEAMRQFEEWVQANTPEGSRPVFVAFNAAFDWMFINDYFHRYLDRNPFGHSTLDMKALYMGLTGVSWSETSMRYMAARYLEDRQLTHNALNDAHDQAELFHLMLDEAQSHGWGWV